MQFGVLVHSRDSMLLVKLAQISNQIFSRPLLRAHCPSIFSSIAIKLNIPRDDFSSIAIELTFVSLGHGFKNDQVPAG